MPLTTATRLYRAAKDTAADSLGGRRAYAIASTATRRHALAAALLDTLALQDDTLPAATVRDLLNALHDALHQDAEHGYDLHAPLPTGARL
jgi:hypothetical protein